MRGMRAGSF